MGDQTAKAPDIVYRYRIFFDKGDSMTFETLEEAKKYVEDSDYHFDIYRVPGEIRYGHWYPLAPERTKERMRLEKIIRGLFFIFQTQAATSIAIAIMIFRAVHQGNITPDLYDYAKLQLAAFAVILTLLFIGFSRRSRLNRLEGLEKVDYQLTHTTRSGS